jgi:hypothetical protein
MIKKEKKKKKKLLLFIFSDLISSSYFLLRNTRLNPLHLLPLFIFFFTILWLGVMVCSHYLGFGVKLAVTKTVIKLLVYQKGKFGWQRVLLFGNAAQLCIVWTI